MLMTTNNSNKRVQSNGRSWRRHINYGNPPWKTGASLRFLSLRRDFLQDCWRSKAALKLKSSTIRCCWDAGGGPATSKRLFTGLRLIVRFFDFPEETRWLLGPGEIGKGTRTGTYSTRPSSNIYLKSSHWIGMSNLPMMAWCHPPPTAYHCSGESFTNLCRSRVSFKHTHTRQPPLENET